MGIPTPASFPKETPEMAAIRAQRALELMQNERAQGEPVTDEELARAAARPRAEGTPRSEAAGPRLVQFNGQVHQFPAEATDDQITAALESLAGPRASQADVRKAEPQPSPMESQKEKEARFADAHKRFVQATGGVLKPGQDIRQAVEEFSGVQDPVKTVEKAEQDELAAGGDLQYGDSVPYAAAKGLASLGGFAVAGPAGATVAEMLPRAVALAFNLTKAVNAGAIDEARAREIFKNEFSKGSAQDLGFNLLGPLIGEVVSKVPGAKWLGDKAVQLVSRGAAGTGKAEAEAAQRARAVAGRIKEATTPEGQQAVAELGKRTGGDVIPTPGQVTGEASYAENAARISHPKVFEDAQTQLRGAAEGMRQDLVNPVEQPRRPVLGQMVLDEADKVQRAVKERLRPAFEAADNVGVKVDFTPVAERAKAALEKNALSPTGSLEPRERSYLEGLVAKLEGTSQNGLLSNAQVSAEGTLDFISRQKETLRELPDYKPSSFYQTIIGDLTESADKAYVQAANRAGQGKVVQDLLKARADYRDMMSTIYDGAVQSAMRKNPEDVGKHFWQNGNVSEVRQLQNVMSLSQREGKMSQKEITGLSRAMMRGFLQEAVPSVEAAAKWSEQLAAQPARRDTWDTLTSSPGGQQLRDGMKVLEEAAKISMRDNRAILGETAIFWQRAAKGGLGLSYVTGVIHPGFIALGVSAQAMTKMMATAYTRGDQGVANLLSRVLRAGSAGTAAGAKTLQAVLPELEKAAAKYDIQDIFVGQQQEQQ